MYLASPRLPYAGPDQSPRNISTRFRRADFQPDFQLSFFITRLCPLS